MLKPTASERKWQLHNEYRERIRRYAWLVLFWVPAGFIGMVTQAKAGFLGRLAAGALIAQAALAWHMVVAINGAGIYSDGWTHSEEGIGPKDDWWGQLLGVITSAGFAFLFALEAITLYRLDCPLPLWTVVVAFGTVLVFYLFIGARQSDSPSKVKKVRKSNPIWKMIRAVLVPLAVIAALILSYGCADAADSLRDDVKMAFPAK